MDSDQNVVHQTDDNKIVSDQSEESKAAVKTVEPSSPVITEGENEKTLNSEEKEGNAPAILTEKSQSANGEPSGSGDAKNSECELKKTPSVSPSQPHSEKEETSEQLPSFPGTVTKSVPGSNDVKIEIDSNSLLDRVILYTLKNSVVDNTRLNAAKNKYMLYNGGNHSSLSGSSNGSDSNKSIEKVAESSEAEIKDSVLDTFKNKQNSDSSIDLLDAQLVKDGDSGSSRSEKSASSTSDAFPCLASEKAVANDAPRESIIKNEILDCRDVKAEDVKTLSQNSTEKASGTIDLTVPTSAEQPKKAASVAKLYVGLPDFSKKIFSDASDYKPPAKIEPDSECSPPRIKNPDFSMLNRQAAPEMQIQQLDFTKSFAPSLEVTPSNFPDIVRKNNYISDLQLKPLSSSPNQGSPHPQPSSYKIDYPSSAVISHQLHNAKAEVTSDRHAYMKRESLSAVNHQAIDEPKAHIIHKNQFVPYNREVPSNQYWRGGPEPRDVKPNVHEVGPAPYMHQAPRNSGCDDKRNYLMEREFKKYPEAPPPTEEQIAHEFSLKRKEQQLRQEGTIITVKNEQPEMRKMDYFRDYKPKMDSTEADRRQFDTNHHNAYPPYAPEAVQQKHQKVRIETIVKPGQSIPERHAQERLQMESSFQPPGMSAYNSSIRHPQMMPKDLHPMAGKWNNSQRVASYHQPSMNYPPQLNHYPPNTPPNSMASYAQQYPKADSTPPTQVNISQNYPPFNPKHSRGQETKEIPNNHYQQAASPHLNSNYYHRNFPDFSRHFDPEKVPHVNGYLPPQHPYMQNRFEHAAKSEGRAFETRPPRPNVPVIDQQMHVMPSQPVRIPEPSEPQPLVVKVERASEFPGPSPASSIPKTSSVFAEVKRESPLDLSVKTVKTKADSTGSERDFPTRSEDPVGMKVEFNPNFGKVSNHWGVENNRSRPQESQSANRRPPPDERLFLAQPPHQDVKDPRFMEKTNHQQYQQVSSNRNYAVEHQFPQTKPPTPLQVPRNHFVDKPRYPGDVLSRQNQAPSQPPPQMYRTGDKMVEHDPRLGHLQPNPPQLAINQVPLPNGRVPPNAALHHDQLRHTNRHPPNPRDPLSYERERDRKYVEEILYRHRKEPSALPEKEKPNLSFPNSAPRKRVYEQYQPSSSFDHKQRKIEGPPTVIANHSYDPVGLPDNCHRLSPAEAAKHKQHTEDLPMMRNLPTLVKSNHFPDSVPQKFNTGVNFEKVHVAPPKVYSPYLSAYPNPKAEMIHRSDFANNKSPHQNFHQRPDDNALQLHPKIPRPIPIPDSGIKNEHQPTGPYPPMQVPASVIASRGADHSTILKLKTNLELKEQKKMLGSDRVEDEHAKKSASPRQFRSKGALKAFVPLPPAAATNPSPQEAPTSAFDLLDWGSACNEFVQQLETGKKVTDKKKRVPKNEKVTPDENQSNLSAPIANSTFDIPKEVINSIKRDNKSSSSDEDKPLLELLSSQAENKSSQSSNSKEAFKFPRNNREKYRLQVEKRHAARLGDPSSSENENESKRAVRTSMKIRRLRKRAALGIKKTDEELSLEEEEESEEEIDCKRRSSKTGEVTSSDEHKKEGETKDPRSRENKSSKNSQSSAKQDASSDSGSSDGTANTKASPSKKLKKVKTVNNNSNIKSLLKEEKTMTRSKRKIEIEKKLSNSKVLRNDKVVHNIVPDKKAKTDSPPKKSSPKRPGLPTDELKKKAPKVDGEKASKQESSSSSEESEPKQPRKRIDSLRSRKDRSESNQEVAKDEKPAEKPNSAVIANSLKDDKSSTKFTPGWEAETYNFKRSLKIPADPQTSDTSEIFSEFVKSKDNNRSRIDVNDKISQKRKLPEPPSDTKKPSSIIDLLHQRVIQSRKRLKNKKPANAADAVQPDDDLLPTPEKESEKVFGFKKNIFETSIISSRTRTENNALRKKEILKEVFGADDDRPKSAPPSGAKEDAEECTIQVEKAEIEVNLSYDQKYREYLEKMNVDFISKVDSAKLDDTRATDVSVKDEEDDEDDSVTVLSEKEMITPSFKGKGKKGRGRRCKGSSGFDYIRKKKKPASHTSENPMSVNNIIKKRLAAMENLENKDENDISKEIKGWVLNKGVGESVLHKASRLDYVDVIAYCVDRLNMNPDMKDNAGYTPLHVACSRGHLEIARILLQYNANHSETALSGIRPLHEAIENGHVEIVRLLISYGADPCLATYSGQLPIAMAEDEDMEEFLHDYLVDIDDKKGKMRSWYFEGPHTFEDPTEDGFEVFHNMPLYKTEMNSSIASVFSVSLTSVTATTVLSDNDTVISESTAITRVASNPIKTPNQDLTKYQHKLKKCDTNSNNIVLKNANSQECNKPDSPLGKKTKGTATNQIDCNLRKIKKLPTISKVDPVPRKPLEQKFIQERHKEDYDDMIELESDNDILEVEESDAPLPPLYLLKDEGSEKWILLNDLCNVLKIKPNAVLKQICPASPPSLNKELIRELKMSDFLDKAVCLQLFCSGEKLNVRASKVSLVRYNDNVRNLLGVQTIRMNL